MSQEPLKLYTTGHSFFFKKPEEKIRFHDLRHTFAKMSHENEMQVSAAKKNDLGYGRKYEIFDKVEKPKHKILYENLMIPTKVRFGEMEPVEYTGSMNPPYEGRYSPTNTEGRHMKSVRRSLMRKCEKCA